MPIDIAKVRDDEQGFIASIDKMSEIEQMNMISGTKITTLRDFQHDMPGTFVTMLEKLSNRAVQEMQRKMTLGASPARPDNQKFAIVSVTNMRQRSITQQLIVGMVSYMYRALAERSTGGTSHLFLDAFSEEEAAVVRRFLGALFEYNPTENVDRLTSEIIAPEEDRRRRAQTANIKVKREPTRVVDSTIRARVGEKKDKIAERTSASMEFDDGHTVKIDIPVDFYAKFMTYYNSHFDAIYKTAFELFIENRLDGGDDPSTPQYLQEEVIIKALDNDAPNDMSKARDLRRFVLPLANKQWDQSITVYAPKSNQFFDNLADAERELRAIKDLTVSEMIIVETNKPTLTASWREGTKNVIVEDEYAAALLKRFDDDRKMYHQMNNQRVKQSMFINMIEQGENSEEFYEHLRELAPQNRNKTLDEWDEDELRAQYHKWIAENKVYSNADSDFLTFVRMKMPDRNLDKQPLTLDERKRLSKEFSTAGGASEISADDMMACDIYEFGTTDVKKKGGVNKKREYYHGATDLSKKK